MREHGTRSCYQGGCRLPGCVRANTDWQAGYRARTRAVERYTIDRVRGGVRWSEPPLPGVR